MEHYRRYALYFAPRSGAFRSACEAWLGRDAVLDQPLVQPDLGLDAEAITQDPRRYGLHGTLKPPFRLAEGTTPEGLLRAVEDFAREAAPIPLGQLAVRRIAGFVALTPEIDSHALSGFASRIVRRFDAFRAPLNAAEIAKRKPEKLSARQRALLTLWGYPFVMEEFRFHLTLTDNLTPEAAAEAEAALAPYLAPHLAAPQMIEDLCLFAETETGRFKEIHRLPLRG